MRVAVKVIPNAPRNEYVGRRGNELVFKIHAQPEKGKANEALIAFMSSLLDIAKKDIAVVSGHTSQHKVIEVAVDVSSKLDALVQN